MEVEEYTRLKSSIGRLRQQKARAEGALAQTEKRLSEELGVSMVEAGGRIAELEKRAEGLRRLVELRLEAFSEKWGKRLEEVR